MMYVRFNEGSYKISFCCLSVLPTCISSLLWVNKERKKEERCCDKTLAHMFNVLSVTDRNGQMVILGTLFQTKRLALKWTFLDVDCRTQYLN